MNFYLIVEPYVYSLVPGKILDRLEIEPYKEVSFSLADGTTIKRKVVQHIWNLKVKVGQPPVVYGEEGDSALLGVTTLESPGLVLNPFTRTLHPMRMLMIGLK